MSRDQYNIHDIIPNMKKNWTVLIQVLECGHIQLKQGTRVQALIWSNDLDYYENTFEPYKRYQISNANLIYTEPRFQLDSYEYSWTLSKLTLIEPFQDETSPTLTCNFTFTPFSDLYKYADEERDINVRGIVIKCFPSQKMKQGQEPSSKRDVIIVNEEKKLLILTLWNYINENEGNTLEQIVEFGPMIFALRVKVTTFYGQSLSTSSSSAILINPPVTDDLQLKNWYTNSKTGIKKLLQQQTYKDTDILLPPPQERDILPIGEAITRMKNGKPTWIKGSLMLPRQDRSFTQTACANCLKPVVADVQWIITCFACKKQSKVQLLSRAIVEIDDGTGSIAAMISTPEIEKFMKVDYNDIKDAGENEQTVQNIIAKSIASLPLLAYVRSYQTSNQENQTTRFVVVKAHRLPEHQNENKQQLQLSNKEETLSTTKQCSPKQPQKRNQTDSGKAKLTETSTAGTSRPTKKLK
ncbi:unnamed protein product [Lactuca saligna]|uniref:Replication protein A OB domain-containing protein n=1 Tax=Lactuca saligna TaxID=75948 RepID=A0AA35Y0X3_LACSI|nr:unnamed protein product [Lactuca saligna]